MRRFVIKLQLLYAHITVTRSKTRTSERSPIFALLKLKTILPDIFSKKNASDQVNFYAGYRPVVT